MELQWRPFWTESVQALLHEGKEIAVAEINKSRDSRDSSVSCEEHLQKGDFAAASGPFCGYEGAVSKKCFEMMGASNWQAYWLCTTAMPSRSFSMGCHMGGVSHSCAFWPLQFGRV